MKKIPLMVIPIIILLTSFLAPIKVSGERGGRVGGVGGLGGYGGPGGGIGSTAPPKKDPDAPVSGYKGGIISGKPQPGGDTGPAIIIRPKTPKPKWRPRPIEDEPKKKPPITETGGSFEDEPPVKVPPMPMPEECKPEVRECIRIYIYGGYGWPMYHGSCCLKLKHSVKCVCKFIKAQDAELRSGAHGVLKGCHYHLHKQCPI